MEHLVESHLGGHYISSCDVDVLEEYCEQCGDSDRVILSWEEDCKLETLKEYFSSLKMSFEKLDADKKQDLAGKEELTDGLCWAFDEDRDLINELAKDGKITLEERIELLKVVSNTQKSQFEILKGIFYPNGFVRRKTQRKPN